VTAGGDELRSEPRLHVKLPTGWVEEAAPEQGPVTYEKPSSGALVKASFVQFEGEARARDVAALIEDATHVGRDIMQAGEPVRTDGGTAVFGQYGTALFSPRPELATQPPTATVQVWFLSNGTGGLLIVTYMSAADLDSVDRAEAEALVMSSTIAWRTAHVPSPHPRPWWKRW
jgi:hypothetical protein